MASEELKVGPAPVSGNGAVTNVRRARGAWVVEFMSEPRTSPEPLWFHLRCEGAGQRRIRFVWLNADGCLGLGTAKSLRNVRPVLRLDDGPWRRVERVRLKRRTTGGQALTFATPAACCRASAAFCYPYGPDDLERTLMETGEVWDAETIGLTGNGRRLLRLRRCPVNSRGAGSKGRRKARPGAYVIARQHAGETPGSWVLDGLLRAVAATEAGPRHARARHAVPLREIDWWVVPLVDLDGAVEGNYGKDALPIDFNRAWSQMPMRPEVLAIQRDMRRFAGHVGRRLVLDLHAPGGGEKRFYMFLCGDDRPAPQREAGESLIPYVAAEFPEIPRHSLAVVPRYPSRWDKNHTATAWAWDHLDGTLGVTFETAYQAIGHGPWLEPEHYRDVGRRIARAAAAALSCG